MGDNNMSIVPDVIKSTSEAIQANIPETARQTDGALSTIVGFFNNVVLYPVRKANLTFRYKLEAFEDDLREKIKGIPDEHLQVPPTMIAGPTLEALRYTYDEEELREMYENLLASAMDSRKAPQAHPAFVDAIKQMSPLDAKILSLIVSKGQLPCGEIRFELRQSEEIYMNGMPIHFVVELNELGDPFEISTSITNLERLCLIRILDTGIKGVDYESMKSHPYVLSRKEEFDEFGEVFEITLMERAITLDDYGKQFATICLAKEV